ncbi:hypothetical protein HELRODRAFT_163642 [Helobdella robusta]|uniref:Tetraspanin n=1 Tax=Helobdella robusta TaxID=6412 RepID=T1EUA9_HELRO|nr:hypothetical protein HELRODRAFT_163642 [Helobdella robusta]ESN96565.1 hypothetical protein HELRODRAFT_163642 [Helobdella robusta]
MSVSVKCLQIIVSVLCFLMMILGIILLVLGIMAYNVYHTEVNANVSSISYMVVGSFIVAVAIFGLVGAICKNYCLLIIYSKLYEDGYKRAIETYHTEKNSKEFVDHAQKNFQCCGYVDYTEWAASFFDFKHGVLPMSCCVEGAKVCNINHNFHDVHKKRVCEYE